MIFEPVVIINFQKMNFWKAWVMAKDRKTRVKNILPPSSSQDRLYSQLNRNILDVLKIQKTNMIDVQTVQESFIAKNCKETKIVKLKKCGPPLS